MFEQIKRRSIVGVLIVGFTLVILLLLAAGFIGVRNARFIKESTAELVQEQLVTTRLIDEVQKDQETLSEVFYYLEGGADAKDRNQILKRLDSADKDIARILDSVSDSDQSPLWDQFRAASKAFLADARDSLDDGTLSQAASSELLRRHEEVVSIVAKLTSASSEKASVAQTEIQKHSQALVDESFLLLGGGLLLSLFCAVLTVGVTTTLFTKMEWQANELSRVSWHMVRDQETSARRFSHELHDELGQALTAIKTNLAALGPNLQPEVAPRIHDCIHLADEAIQNVRELSQLLHPVILDDFGLDAGLRWLCDGFTTRTGIHVEYVSLFPERPAEETELHLFRIVQEALTNVARHSGATRVSLILGKEGGRIRLSIHDNGHGLAAPIDAAHAGIGIVGMRARARSAGGELTVKSSAQDGVLIEVSVPATV